MAERKTAKIFSNGRSQAVRLPREFRFQGKEVAIRRDEATGGVLLSPIAAKDGDREAAGVARTEDGEKAAPRSLSLDELFAIFDQAEFPEDFFEREKSAPRELDLF